MNNPKSEGAVTPGTGTELNAPMDRLMRLSEVSHFTGLGRATIYRWMGTNEFPLAVSLGGSRVAWRQSDIRAWIESRPLNPEIRASRSAVPWSTASKRRV